MLCRHSIVNYKYILERCVIFTQYRKFNVFSSLTGECKSSPTPTIHNLVYTISFIYNTILLIINQLRIYTNE